MASFLEILAITSLVVSLACIMIIGFRSFTWRFRLFSDVHRKLERPDGICLLVAGFAFALAVVCWLLLELHPW